MKVQSDAAVASLHIARADSAAAHKGAQAEKAEKAQTNQASVTSSSGPASSLELSADVGHVEAIRSAAKSEPDFRPDVVAQARADMAAGTLTADSGELAALMAQDIF